MEYLADTNVLLRSTHQTHPMHPTAITALSTLLRSGERVCVTPQNIIEFWNVCTRQVDRNGLGLTPGQADREASRLEGLLTLLPDVPAIYPEWRRLVVAHSVSGVQVHDARIAAAMNVYAIRNPLTFNGPDFTRYLGVQEIERWRPSRTSGESGPGTGPKRESKTDAEERLNRQAVSASEISGLPERRGYLKSGNFIVPLTVERQNLPVIAERFISRQLPPMFPVSLESKGKELKDEPPRQQEQRRVSGEGQTYFR